MRSLSGIYRLINILSLDVVVGSVISALFFASVFGVSIRPYGLAALALTVWIIYTADHLRDAIQIRHTASSARHAFHQKYRAALLRILVLAIVLDLAMLFFVRTQVLWGGVILSGIIALYLLIQRRFHFLKEIFVAALYVLGILLPSVVVVDKPISPFHVGLIVQFFLISLLNLYVFSLFGVDDDKQDDLGSFALRFGNKTTFNVLRILFAVNFILGIGLLIADDTVITSLVPIAMTTLLYFIFRFAQFFKASEYYRIAGDAVFFIPLIYLLWPS